ncbi:MAG: PHP domain-containing protein [Armatimonadetes bacterium]|nr:PHP domain-containing protein [Armatimonadota bacterium]
MKLTCDWHIHSDNSCDDASMRIADLITGAAAQGIVNYGITDHIHTPVNWPDVEASRAEYLASDPPLGFHFGLEVSCVSRWELDEVATGAHGSPTYGLRQGGPPGAEPALSIEQADIDRLGIEYVVAGVHWPMYVEPERDTIIRDYHRQYLYCATHPLVDIIAHPWWWHGHWRDADGRYTTDPWLDDFGKIPASMHDELASAAIEHGKAVEINISAILLNPAYPATLVPQYLEYLAYLRDRGVTFSLASDCHRAQYDIDFERPAAMLESIGIRDEALWRLPARVGAV